MGGGWGSGAEGRRGATGSSPSATFQRPAVLEDTGPTNIIINDDGSEQQQQQQQEDEEGERDGQGTVQASLGLREAELVYSFDGTVDAPSSTSGIASARPFLLGDLFSPSRGGPMAAAVHTEPAMSLPDPATVLSAVRGPSDANARAVDSWDAFFAYQWAVRARVRPAALWDVSHRH